LLVAIPLGAATLREFPAAEGFHIAASRDGDLWLTLDTTDKIGLVTTTGAFQEIAMPGSPTANRPYALVWGPDDNLWLTDPHRQVIHRRSKSGDLRDFVVSSVDEPAAIAVGPDGNLWFTEFHHLGRITPSGT